MTPLHPARRLANWAVVLLVGVLAVVALAAALAHEDPSTPAAQPSASRISSCRLGDLSLALRIADEPPHFVTLGYLGSEPCELVPMSIFATIEAKREIGTLRAVSQVNTPSHLEC